MAAAAAVPRKQAASSADEISGSPIRIKPLVSYWPTPDGKINPKPKPVTTPYLPLEQALADQITWLWPSGGCGAWLITKVLCLVNNRTAFLERNGREPNGYTAPLSVQELRENCSFQKRMVEYMIDRLTSGETPILLKMSTADAVGAGIITREDYSSRRQSILLAANRDVWPELIRAAQKKAKERERKLALAEKSDEEAPAKSERRIVAITSRPVIRRSGDRAARIKLDPEAQAALSAVEAIRVKGDHSSQISFQVTDSVLECSLEDAPSSDQAAERTEGESAQSSAHFQSESDIRTKSESAQSSARFASVADTSSKSERGAQCITPPLKASNSPQADETKQDFFTLNDYPDFVVKTRQKFPPTTNSSLSRVIQACRESAMAAGLEPDWVTDRVLVHAMIQRGVTPKIMCDIGYWLKAKDGEPGTLVRCVANWAQEFALTGTVREAEDLRPEWESVREALEATRGQW